MKKILVRVALVTLVSLALRGCFGTSWNQRLTLVIETPHGEVSGSSVTKVSFSPRNKIILRDLDSSTLRLRGEAAMVEVLPGRWLFALLPDQERLIYSYVSDQQADGHIGLEEAIPLILDQTDPLTLDPNTKNSLDYAPRFPILATFEDITKPETVREVDPEDLDATFGCEQDDAAFPWRKKGMMYRDWADLERARLLRERAADEAGLTGTAREAIIEFYAIVDANRFLPEDKARAKELRKLFSVEQEERWVAARQSLYREAPATVPTPESLAATAGGQCYRIKAVTIEVTRDAVTEGRVESLPFWAELLEQVTFSGLDRFSEAYPDPTNYLTYKTLRVN